MLNNESKSGLSEPDLNDWVIMAGEQASGANANASNVVRQKSDANWQPL